MKAGIRKPTFKDFSLKTARLQSKSLIWEEATLRQMLRVNDMTLLLNDIRSLPMPKSNNEFATGT